MSTAEQLALALEALVKNEGLDVFVYLDNGIGSSTKAGQRWLEARAAVAAYRSTPADGGGQAEEVCAEAYQVVGSLLSDVGQFEIERAVKILDNLSQARLVHNDVLPWPSFAPVGGGQGVTPLTPEQRRRLWDNSPEIHGDATSRAGFERIVALVEAVHRIGTPASTGGEDRG